MTSKVINYLYDTRRINTLEYKSLLETKSFFDMDVICLVNIYHQAGLIFNKERFENDYQKNLITTIDNQIYLRNNELLFVLDIQPEFNFSII